MDEFQIIELVKKEYNITRIKRRGKVLLIALEVADENFNTKFLFWPYVEQYYKKGNCCFYYVILKFDLL